MDNRIKHNFLTKENKLPRFYIIWLMMKQRCFNKNHTAYKRYGGNGIKVCERWLHFNNFKIDMHEKYLMHVKRHGIINTTLDRISNAGNYELNNCRWSTKKQQSKNRKCCIEIKKRINKLFKKTNLPKSLIKSRISHGWTNDEIIENKPNFKYYSLIKNNKHTIDMLEDNRKKIIYYRYGLEDGKTHSLKETGIKFNSSKQNINQIEQKVINFLQN